ncbi:MAG: polysaccharide biosynthesis protein, partial [Armatimonadetes bacterium]|nr:polysaccharide biosynthesis protein [Armatimonadota bacterium]
MARAGAEKRVAFLRGRLRPARVALAVTDAVCVTAALSLAAMCHYSGNIPAVAWKSLQGTVPLAAAFLVGTNILFGLYNRVWRYAAADTAVAIGASVTISQIAAAFAGRELFGPLPVGIWVTSWLATMVVTGAVRFFWRSVRLRLRAPVESNSTPKRVIIYGAGDHGELLVRSLKAQFRGRYEVVGYVDDDPAKMGTIVGYAKVLGGGRDLPALVERYEVDEVILAMPRATRADMEAAFEHCRAAGVDIKVMPHILETMEPTRARRVRQIDVADLLGRHILPEDISLRDDYIAGRTVLVTGAGGSIGSEICRQVCRYKPKRLILLGRGENRIHWLYLELSSLYPETQIIPIVGCVGVRSSTDNVLRLFRPEVIIHAAAHKHVYLMEFVPAEAARNNVLATAALAEQAEDYGVERFVMISTDKAACPSNVMGATKRMAELVLTRRPNKGTSFTCVRFGNVLGSEGSVLEIWRRQWARREPITITHPEATRYFMSIQEACFLVLQAGALNGNGTIFLLDMGEPIRIIDFAKQFITLQGGDPDAPEAIRVTGLRPGERLHEVLVCEQEEAVPSAVPQILQVQPTGELPSWSQIRQYLKRLEEYCNSESDEAVCGLLEEVTGAQLSVENCHS